MNRFALVGEGQIANLPRPNATTAGVFLVRMAPGGPFSFAVSNRQLKSALRLPAASDTSE
jgi:hypothetical protein